MDRRIKIAMVANNLELNGISSVIVNYCTHIDKEKFDIAVLVGAPINSSNRKKCLDAGAEVVELPSKRTDSKAFYKALNAALKGRDIDIFHVHGNGTVMSAELAIAKYNHIKHRIAHSHNTTCGHLELHKILRPAFDYLVTDAFACGEDAGNWLFPNRSFVVIPNGFDIDKFMFDPEVRQNIRNELGIQDDELVLGHIGRINAQKNQKFLLQVFEQIAKENEKTRLLMVGIGPEYDEVKQMVSDSPYKERITMYGESDHPEEMYSAMDEFVFPSRYEGLPITLLEAQINGLPCTVSDVITDEVIINDNVKKEALSAGVSVWKNATLKNTKRCHTDYEKFSKYRIEYGVKKLENEYLRIMGEK